ncbi:MAG: hypothetical protein ACLQVD_12470 [Capsulimonadaceae bacterium]
MSRSDKPRMRAAGISGLILALALSSCAGLPPAQLHGAPARPGALAGNDLDPAVYTACGAVRQLAFDPGDGGLWAATSGGVLRWDAAGGVARRWTCRDGLPSNDVLSISIAPGGVAVRTAGAVDPSGTSAGRCMIDSGGTVCPVKADDPVDGSPWSLDGRMLHVAGLSDPVPLPAECPLPLTAVSLDAPGRACAAADRGLIVASTGGLWQLGRSPGHPAWSSVALPANSPASHVSALAGMPGTTYAGLYGDGVYVLRGNAWTKIAGPDSLQYVRSIAVAGGRLAVATRDGGVEACDVSFLRPSVATTAGSAGKNWINLVMPATSLPSADIQSLALWRGSLWAATFDRGVVELRGKSTRQYGVVDGLDSNSPRALLSTGGALYARDAGSHVDVFDGSRWHRADWERQLPRREVYCMAHDSAPEARMSFPCANAPGDDSGGLLVGGWGGWARIRIDKSGSATVEPHYTDPALHAQVVTCLCADGNDVWIGTSDNGLLRYSGGRYTEYHEAAGLTDDWITTIAASNGRLLAGTYTGGLLERDGDHFKRVLAASRYAIRSVAFAPNGDAYAATPLGVYLDAPGKDHWTLLDPLPYGGPESQCLCVDQDVVWVGSRTSLGGIATRRE